MDRPNGQLANPLDPISIRILDNTLDRILLNKVMDVLWNKIFWFITHFETLQGYTASGVATLDGTGLTLSTTAVLNNQAYLRKQPNNQSILNFGIRSRFRSAFQQSSIANNTCYIVAGQAINATGDQYYGFKITNGRIQSVCSQNGTSNEALIDLGVAGAALNISINTVYTIEARYYPNNQVSFFIWTAGANQVTSPNPVAIIKDLTKLPIPATADKTLITNLFAIEVQTTTTAIKSINVSMFEFIQAKNVIV